MYTAIAPAAPAVLQEASTFRIKLEVGIKNSENGVILLSGEKFETEIKLPKSYGSYQSRVIHCENIALGKYAEKLEKDLETNRTLKRRLANVDWTIYSKTKSVVELT